MSKKYIEFANGTKRAIPEQSDPKNEWRGNSPVPDQDLGNGVYIKEGILHGNKENQERRKNMMFVSWEHSEEPKDKTRH